MNPQSFRRKLEEAVVQRDSTLLAELEQLAPENPTTAEIWRQHQQLEGVLDSWRIPASATTRPLSETQPKRLGMSRLIRATLAASCLFLVYRSLVPEINFWGGSPEPPQVVSADSSWLERWQGSWSPWSTDEAGPNVPGSEAELAGANTAGVTTGAELAANKTPTAEDLAATPLVTYSLALADQSQRLLPARLLPVLPDMSLQLEQGIFATWDTLSAWPREMQDAWRTLQAPAEEQPEWDEESGETPAHPPLRRMRGRRTFSFGSSGSAANPFLA